MKKIKPLMVVLMMTALAFTACGKEATDQINTTEATNHISSSTTDSTPVEPEITKPADTSVIDSFLKGETTAVVSDKFKNELIFCLSELDFDTLDTHFILPDTFTINDMITGIENGDYASEAVLSTEYYTASTANDKNVLFLKINGLNLYYTDDGSFSFYAFVENNGQLELTFACDSYYANELEIDDDLSFAQTGFDVSGTNYSRRGMINADGEYEFVYNLRTLVADSIGMEIIENYNGIDEFTDNDIVDWISTKNNVYYHIYNLSGNQEKYAKVLAQIENMGAELVEDTDTTITQTKENAGLRSNSTPITDWVAL